MLRIIIAGSRFFDDYDLLKSSMIRTLFELNKKYPQHNILYIDKKRKVFKINTYSLEIISGTANGADSLGARFAQEFKLPLKEFPADWKNLNAKPCKIMENSHGKYNALAGHNRNKDMAIYASSKDTFGVLVLFWDGKSSGSKNMKNQAIAFGLEIYEYIINKHK